MEHVSADEKLDAAAALALARKVGRVVAVRGPAIVVLDTKNAPPTEREILAAILGPTGNLRAPSLVVGGTLIVGFREDVYGAEIESGAGVVPRRRS